MSKFVDFDPLRGIETLMSHSVDELQIHYRQDVEPVLDLAAIERSTGLADKKAKEAKWGEEISLYARIPPVIILEMKHKYGVDLFKKDHLKRAFELINREYPKYKTTEKHHSLGKAGAQVFIP
jgi:hypothetical protein